MELTGAYQEKNIYIQNPFAGSGTGFCTIKVLVNGKETSDSINSSAFEINLKKYNFKYGDSINIQIYHKPDCKPKVLLTDWHRRQKSTFELVSIQLDTNGILYWKTKNERDKLPFIVEQFRWNKWIKVGEVDGKGGKEENEYSLKVLLHSGENQIRVKQMDHTSKYPNISQPAKVVIGKISSIPGINQTEKTIVFNTETIYEIYDEAGNIVKKGTGKTADCSALPKGIYYLNYDNKTIELLIRKTGEMKLSGY